MCTLRAVNGESESGAGGALSLLAHELAERPDWHAGTRMGLRVNAGGEHGTELVGCGPTEAAARARLVLAVESWALYHVRTDVRMSAPCPCCGKDAEVVGQSEHGPLIHCHICMTPMERGTAVKPVGE